VAPSHTAKRARAGLDKDQFVPHSSQAAELFMGRSRGASAKKVNKKMNRLALCSALSDRAQSERVVVVDQWQFETPKTKDALTALENLDLEGKVMMVVAASDDATIRSFRNLPSVQLVQAAELNAYDVLCSDWLVFTAETLPGANS
jgi:large subunit ribosomal protein L4